MLHPRVRVDVLLPGRLVVEVDGASHHGAAADARRVELLRSLGHRVLRFPYERVVSAPERVLDEVEAELSRS